MLNKSQKTANFFQKAIAWVFFILAIFIFVVRYINMAETAKSFGGNILLILCVIGLFAILFAFLYFGNTIIAFAKKIFSKLSANQMLIIVLGLAVVLRALLLLILPIDSSIHPDINVYVNTTRQLVNSGVVESNAIYVIEHYYMFVFSTLFYLPVLIFGESIFVFNITISILYIIATLALFDTLKYIFNKNIAFVVAIAFTILPCQLFLSEFLIHENCFVIFSLIAFWLLFRVIPSTNKLYIKILLLFALGLSISFCALINYWGYLLFACLFLYGLVLLLKKYSNKLLLHLIVATAIIIISYFGLSATYGLFKSSSLVLPEDYSAPKSSFAWAFYLGFNVDSSGGWSAEDVEKFNYKEADWTDEEINNYKNDLVKARFNNLFSPPTNVIKLGYNKFKLIWGNNNYTLSYANETISNPATASTYNLYVYKPLYIINELCIILFVFMLIISCKPQKDLDHIYLTLYKTFLIAAALILLLVEVNYKYSMFIPHILLILGLLSYKNFAEISVKFKDKINMLFRKKDKIQIEETNTDNSNS